MMSQPDPNTSIRGRKRKPRVDNSMGEEAPKPRKKPRKKRVIKVEPESEPELEVEIVKKPKKQNTNLNDGHCTPEFSLDTWLVEKVVGYSLDDRKVKVRWQDTWEMKANHEEMYKSYKKRKTCTTKEQNVVGCPTEPPKEQTESDKEEEKAQIRRESWIQYSRNNSYRVALGDPVYVVKANQLPPWFTTKKGRIKLRQELGMFLEAMEPPEPGPIFCDEEHESMEDSEPEHQES